MSLFTLPELVAIDIVPPTINSPVVMCLALASAGLSISMLSRGPRCSRKTYAGVVCV